MKKANSNRSTPDFTSFSNSARCDFCSSVSRSSTAASRMLRALPEFQQFAERREFQSVHGRHLPPVPAALPHAEQERLVNPTQVLGEFPVVGRAGPERDQVVQERLGGDRVEVFAHLHLLVEVRAVGQAAGGGEVLVPLGPLIDFQQPLGVGARAGEAVPLGERALVHKERQQIHHAAVGTDLGLDGIDGDRPTADQHQELGRVGGVPHLQEGRHLTHEVADQVAADFPAAVEFVQPVEDEERRVRTGAIEREAPGFPLTGR
jgi:hypothetical protein